MRRILPIIALFSLCGATAQEYIPSYGLERPRSEIRIYPTAEEAAAAGRGADRYCTPLTEWSRKGNTFSTHFTLPFAWINRQVLFRLERASCDYEIRVNGRTAAYNADGNAPAEVDLTKLAKEGRNTLEVVLSEPAAAAVLESWKEHPAPEIGQAWVMSQPTLRIRDIRSRTRIGEDGDATAEVAVVVKTGSLNPRTSRLHYTLLSPSGETVTTGTRSVTLGMRGEDTVRFLARIPYDSLWSDARTTQYRLLLKTQHEGRYVEYIDRPIGFRSIAMQEDGTMEINGRSVTLRTREVPGNLTPEQVADLQRTGCNTIRLLPGPVSEQMLTACDTCGMYVIAQTPVDTRRSGDSRRVGGNPSNNPAWRDAYIERAENCYYTLQGHPSVVAFSLATCSANGINLYESYLRMKKLPEQRPFIYPEAAGEWNSDRLKTSN